MAPDLWRRALPLTRSRRSCCDNVRARPRWERTRAAVPEADESHDEATRVDESPSRGAAPRSRALLTASVAALAAISFAVAVYGFDQRAQSAAAVRVPAPPANLTSRAVDEPSEPRASQSPPATERRHGGGRTGVGAESALPPRVSVVGVQAWSRAVR